MLFLIVLIGAFFLVGAIIYMYLNNTGSLWTGFLDFLSELLYANGLWHPYLDPAYLLSYDQAITLVEGFQDLLIHPTLMEFDVYESRGIMSLQIGFLDWKLPFKELPRAERMAKIATSITFFYRANRRVRLLRNDLFFLEFRAGSVTFAIPLNDAGRQRLSGQRANRM